MKLIFTKHSSEKFEILKQLGWKITREQVKTVVQKPRWVGKSRFGQKTAMNLVDDQHILRVIFDQENGRIKVITFHIARRGKYESTL